ncbi:MAG: assimilatory sulfite reductase (NADPH) hemoprotein subunit [Immundisolibacteraceae bacterium]|nr:assimilatory sulfite reductase (NADPH) hemoprotein subunit [Immundisolibacteraceae bacterium]
MNAKEEVLSPNEPLKLGSNYLRGTIVEGLQNPVTGGISDDDAQLIKFHGCYLQDDRDVRQERLKQKLEPLYSFLIRVRMAGGVCSPSQWLELDRLAQSHANQSLRLTTRQTFQFHGVLKRNLRDTIYQINQTLLNTIAACGDVNRNVMVNVLPEVSGLHQQAYHWGQAISDRLLPKTSAYHEIWLGKTQVAGQPADSEPVYGETYLPRKFKIGIAVPPRNDIDVFSQDIGLIAVADGDDLIGFNVAVGGGLGRTHGDDQTYARLGSVIGYCPADKVVEVCEQILCIQRDHGNRSNRKQARLKYTVDRHGVEWFGQELNKRLGWNLGAARSYHFDTSGDPFGWVEGDDGLGYYTLFIESGRVKDFEDYPLMTGLREIASVLQGEFRLTGNQNLCIAKVPSGQRAQIDELLARYGLDGGLRQSNLRKASMSCVGLPTCGLAMAESERYLPEFVTRVEELLAEVGLPDEPIIIRIIGCPNGCGRAPLAEIGLVGKSPGHYQLWLGASPNGDRLNQLVKESATEAEILQLLRPILQSFAQERLPQERFGDFVTRSGYVDDPAGYEI